MQDHASTGLVLDANLLLLMLIGKVRRKLITTPKRSNVFTEDDFYALEAIVSRFQAVTTTPNVLTEVSNLCDRFEGEDKNRYLEVVNNHVNTLTEEYIPSRDVIAFTAFSQFGLSDAVIAEIAGRNLLVLTIDSPLYHYLLTMGLPAINFNQLRTEYWT